MKTASKLRKLSMFVTVALVLALASVMYPFMNQAEAANNNAIRVYDVVIERWTGSGAPPKCDGLPIDNSGARACVHWKWDASAANPQAGDSFYLQLPLNFVPLDPADYDIMVTLPNVAEKQKIGTCRFTGGTKTVPAKVTCTFDEGLTRAQEAGNVNLTGTGWIVVRAFRTGDDTGHDFDLNGTITRVPNPGNKPIPPWVPGQGSFGQVEPGKYADSVYSNHKEIYWHIYFTTEKLAEKFGGRIPNPLVITDTLSEGQRFNENEAVDIRIVKSEAVPLPSVNIRVGTSNPTRKALSNSDGHTIFTVSPVYSNGGRTMTLTITPQNGDWEPKTYYQINYNAVPTTANGVVDRGIVYGNEARIQGWDKVFARRTVYIAAAGGTAQMDPGYGSFSLTKLVDGPAVNQVPSDAKVRVAVKWTLPGGKQANEFPGWTPPAQNPFEMEVSVGKETIYNPNNRPFPVGTEIELKELDSPAGAAVTWTNPRFKVGDGPQTNAKATFTIEGAKVTPVELVNEAVVKRASVCVGDYVFEDVNKDGLQDAGDKPIVGAKLSIVGPNDQPVTDINGNPVGETTTNDKGLYKFCNLPTLGDAAQKYTVKVVELPAGYEAYVPTTAGANNGAGENDSSTGTSASVKPLTTDGAADLTLDFGYVRTVPGIDIEKYVGDWAGIKFDAGVPQLTNGQPAVLPVGDHDTEADALLLKETAKADVKFTVTNTGTAELTKVTVTDKTAAGPALTDFKCEIGGATVEAVNGVVTAPDTFKLIPGASFDCTAVMPALGDHLTHANTAVVEATPVAGGEPVKDGDDFHAKRPAKVCVGNYVFEDINKDGLQNAGDKPIAGVELSISRTDGKPVMNVAGEEVKTTHTDADGKYSFCELELLPAGEKYVVSVTTPKGFIPAKANVGTDRVIDSSTGKETAQELKVDKAEDLTLDFGFMKVKPVPPDLPNTGASVAIAATVGLVLAGLGGALVMLRRKKTN